MNEVQIVIPKAISYLVFKTVGSNGAVVKATGAHSRRVLKT